MTPRDYECNDCGWTGDNVKPVRDLHERVLAGDTMPAGQCPACGALVFDEDGNEETAANATQMRALLQAIVNSDGDYYTDAPECLASVGKLRIAIDTARNFLEDTPKPAPIIVTVEGGVVQDVSNVPAGMSVAVIDYDDGLVAECSALGILKDKNGDLFTVGIYDGAGAASSEQDVVKEMEAA